MFYNSKIIRLQCTNLCFLDRGWRSWSSTGLRNISTKIGWYFLNTTIDTVKLRSTLSILTRNSGGMFAISAHFLLLLKNWIRLKHNSFSLHTVSRSTSRVTNSRPSANKNLWPRLYPRQVQSKLPLQLCLSVSLQVFLTTMYTHSSKLSPNLTSESAWFYHYSMWWGVQIMLFFIQLCFFLFFLPPHPPVSRDFTTFNQRLSTAPCSQTPTIYIFPLTVNDQYSYTYRTEETIIPYNPSLLEWSTALTFMQAQYGYHINELLKDSLLLTYLSLHSLRSRVRLTQFPSTMTPDLATVGADDFLQATYKAQPSQCSCSPCNGSQRRSFTHHQHIRGIWCLLDCPSLWYLKNKNTN